MSRVRRTPSSRASSQMISAVQLASGSTRLTVPKRVLSWWWSMLSVLGEPLTAGRRRVAVDVAAVQEDHGALGDVGGDRLHESVQGEGPVLVGERQIGRRDVHHAVLAQAGSSPCIATSEPIASPSGLSCGEQHEAPVAAQALEHRVALARTTLMFHRGRCSSPSTRIARSVVSS